MSKANLKEIEILHSIYQFSDQYGVSTAAIKQHALLECLKHLNKNSKESKNITAETLASLFPELSPDERKTILDAFLYLEKAPKLHETLTDKLQLSIGKQIKNEWIDSTLAISKKIAPLILIAVAIFFGGQKFFYPKKWRATYFQNTQLSGTPFGTYEEASPNHNWGFEVPQAGMTPNNYSIRFESILVVNDPDYYTFRTVSDDGIRLYINDELVLDYWVPQDSVKRETTKHLEKGEYTVRLEYFEAEAGAKLEFEATSSKSSNVKFKYPKS